MRNLKPCPFCGAKPVKMPIKTDFKNYPIIYKLACKSDSCFICPETPTSHRIEDCVDYWNRRAEQQEKLLSPADVAEKIFAELEKYINGDEIDKGLIFDEYYGASIAIRRIANKIDKIKKKYKRR